MKYSRYIFPQAFSSLKVNGWLTLAAVATIAISLFLCLVFWVILLNIDANATSLESEVEIVAYINSDVAEADYPAIQNAITQLPGFLSIQYVSREDGLATVAPRFGSVDDLLASMGGVNPLPNAYTVKAVTPEDVASLAQAIGAISGIGKVRYGQDQVEKLFSLTSTMRYAGFAIMILLAVAAVVLVAMTTRISVYARKQEIMVMKWVGATNWFIRWPFLLQGVILGLIGSLLAVLSAFLLYGKACAYAAAAIPFIVMLPLSGIALMVGGVAVLAGVLMGALGSVISMTRFLNV